MPCVAPLPPAENDLLCESCGYTLNGLPPDGNCPECGKPIDASIAGRREPPPWESPHAGNALSRFFKTSALVIFRPTRFYKSITTRGGDGPAKIFGHLHWHLAAILFGMTGSMHLINVGDPRNVWVGAAVFTILAFGGLAITTWAAVRLTAWEARYRGYRLPLGVVRRGMHYHAAHYFPVALVAFITVFGYRWMIHRQYLDGTSANAYLYVLCVEVVVAAAYLFKTYWIGMRNMMYANK